MNCSLMWKDALRLSDSYDLRDQTHLHWDPDAST